MNSYKTAMKIIHGSIRYEFGGEHGNELTLSSYYDGTEITLDFDGMTEETFDDLIVNDVEYDDAMRILRGSKEYAFEDTVLVVRSYYTGDEIRLDLDNLTDEMLEELMPYGQYNEFDDEAAATSDGWGEAAEDEFADAVDSISEESSHDLQQ